VVRGSAPLLAPAAGLVYFLVAPGLPAPGGDAGLYLAGTAGAVAVALCALAPLRGREEPGPLVAFGVGAALLAVALNARGVGAASTPAEAMFAASAGLLFGVAFAAPAAVVALPLLVAGIDLASVLGAGGESLVVAGDEPDVLTLDLPLWGGDGDVARLGLLDATFLALFAAWSLHFDLRPRLALVAMPVALAASVALGVTLDSPVPALPFLAAAFLLSGADRLPRLVRGGG
jgi:hypothetical protein